MDNEQQDNFFKKVHEVVNQIPYGKVTTYGAIASYLGITFGARMVGYALNQVGDIIPAHRVLNRLGQLTGRRHFPDDTMRERLRQEGVTFIEPYTVDMDKHFWNPQEELELKNNS